MMTTELYFALGGAGLGTLAASLRRDGWLDAVRLFPLLFISALFAWLFCALIWPVIPGIWAQGHYNEAIGGMVAALLPALVGGLVDPEAPFHDQARGLAWLGCGFVLFCFIGWPMLLRIALA
jgi:hypothetical protein